MSSHFDTAAIVAQIDFGLVDNFCGIAVTALVTYEYLITFRWEFQLFWSKKFSGTNVLFFLNRYLNLVNWWFQIAIGIFSPPKSVPVRRSPIAYSTYVNEELLSCVSSMRSGAFIDALPLAAWGVFSTLRAYALSQSKVLSLLVLPLSLASFGVNVYRSTTLTCALFPVIGLSVVSSVPGQLAIKLIVASRACLMASDTILIAVTWTRLWSHVKTQGLMGHQSLSYVLLYDGTVYFVVLLMLNALHLCLSVISTELPLQSAILQPGVSDITTFIDPITSILVSRFLLHLQASSQRAARGGRSESTSTYDWEQGSSIFARAVGPFGTHVEADDLAGMGVDEDDMSIDTGAEDIEDLQTSGLVDVEASLSSGDSTGTILNSAGSPV